MNITPDLIKKGSTVSFQCSGLEEYEGNTVEALIIVSGITKYETSGIVVDGGLSVTFPGSLNSQIAKSAMLRISYETNMSIAAFDVVLEPVTHSVTATELVKDVAIFEFKLSDDYLNYYINSAFADVKRDLKNKFDNEFLYGVSDFSIVNEMVTVLAASKIIASRVKQVDSALLLLKKDKDVRYNELLNNSKVYSFGEDNTVYVGASVSSVRVIM